ncbi:hypothetical protein XO12_05275 [Marinitoga sp. 1154]|uniref:helix-turn-helix domain-containing protein n=1 Tax=Marinitoga sp. 1154 TaxID=1643335 RepID=UPI0015862482|nr:hypothetical protein [Marinitoga sp. 1154]
MRRKNQEIFNILSNYGSFAKPFLNFMIIKTKHDGWKHLFKSLEYDWLGSRYKALEEIEKGLKHKNSKTLYYILLAKKLSYLFLIRDYTESRKLYIFLRENYSKIPKKARKIVSSILINIENIMNWNKNTRLWGKLYEMDPSTEAFINLGKARRNIKEKKFKTAWKFLKKTFELSKLIPHRVGIINSLNDWSWYLKDFDLKKSISLSKELMYYAGYYFEDNEKHFGIFDTFFEINKENIDTLYLYSNIISFYWNRLPEKGKRNSKENYANMFNYLNKFVIEDRSIYKNTKNLRIYLKKYVSNISEVSKKTGISRKSLSSILNGKVKEIKGDTIKKLISGLNIIPDIYSPKAIINEYGKLYIEGLYRESFSKLKSMPPEQQKRLFFITYISCVKKIDFNNKENIFFENDFHKKWFIIEMLYGNEYINSRKILAKHFFERMKKSRFEEFVFKYFKLSKKEKEILDVFIRNYSRYDIKWNVRIELPEFLNKFADKYSLKKMPLSLAYWYYENGADRRKLVNILDFFD